MYGHRTDEVIQKTAFVLMESRDRPASATRGSVVETFQPGSPAQRSCPVAQGKETRRRSGEESVRTSRSPRPKRTAGNPWEVDFETGQSSLAVSSVPAECPAAGHGPREPDAECYRVPNIGGKGA
jgi:hypothetical protein